MKGKLVIVACGISLLIAPLVAEEKVDTPKPELVGAQKCLECHADRDNFKMSLHANKLAKVKGIAFDQSCETCHGPGSLHVAAAGDRSNPGFATITSFKNLTAAQMSETCFKCHNDQGRVHWDGSVHQTRNVSCNKCHSIHDPQEPKFLLAKASEVDTCSQCHMDVKAALRRNSHMPVLEGKMSCSDCHNPHGSATEKMLAADSVNQLCFKCHTEKRGPFLWTHPPVQENCLTCHQPHGSHNDKMLNEKLPMLCQNCHANNGHNNSAYDGAQIAAQSTTRVINKSCANCHSNIHGSNHPSGKAFQR